MPLWARRWTSWAFLPLPSRMRRPRWRSDFRSGGGIYGETGRFFHADAEELAEGGVAEFFAQLQPFQSKQGVNLTDVEQRLADDDRSYWVSAAGIEHKIYDAREYESERTTPVLWGLSTRADLCHRQPLA